MEDGLLILLAIISGMCFACMGLAFRLGMPRNVHTLHLMGFASAVGLLFFGLRFGPGWQAGVHPWVIGVAVVSGVAQYAGFSIIPVALRMGPLSLLCCVQMLTFVPVIFYAGAAFDERPTLMQWMAVLAAGACVVVASKGRDGEADEPEGEEPRHTAHPVVYSVILLLTLLCNSVLSAGIKDLATRPYEAGGSYMDAFGDGFLALVYATILGCVLIDQAILRRPVGAVRALVSLGALTAFGSMGGLWIFLQCASLPAAVSFTANNIAAILFTAIVAAFLFREKRNWAWYATLACGAASLLLANGAELAAALLNGGGQ